MSFLDSILTQPAKSLATLTGTVSVNTTDPSVGDVLKIVSPGVATWQPGVASALKSTGADIDVSGATPVAGRWLKLTDLTHADWIALPVASGAQDGLMTAALFSATAAHIISTSNPHATTKAQVGLTNVTDDAQLKRANNDWAGYTPITVPTLSDKLLSEISVGGAKGTLSLSALTALIKQQLRDPIWDAPTTGNADNDEFDVDSAASGAWDVKLSSGVALTRDGAVDPTATVLTGHYRSSVVGSSLILQCRQNDSVILNKTVAAALSSNQLWVLGCSMPTEFSAAAPSDPIIHFGFYKNSGGFLDFGNRMFVRTGNSNERYDMITQIAAGATTTIGANTHFLEMHDGLAIRIDHGSAAAGNGCGFAFKRNGSTGTMLGGNGPQYNASNDRIAIGLLSNPTSTFNGNSNVFYMLHFMRRIPVSNPGFLAQA